MLATRHGSLDLVLALARRSRIAGAVCVVVCASLLARAAGHVIEAEYLADPTAAPPLRTAGAPPPPAPPRGDASVLVDRNPFCSGCAPTCAGDPPSCGGGDRGDDLPEVRLPLALIATSVPADPAASIATIRSLDTGGVGAYRAGERVAGAGVVERVAPTYVTIRTDAGARARVDLLAAAPAPPGATAMSGVPDVAARRAAPWADRIRAIDERTFEVDRGLVQELVGAQGKVKGVRVVPAVEDGALRGVRISTARPDSLAAALGLRTGDVIEAIDGAALDDPKVLLRKYGALETASSVRISVARRGETVELEYRLR